jgi:hypothetical protein
VPPRRPRDGEERKQRAEPGEGPGKDRAVYLDLLRRRWLGSAPPTAQAYARALNLWSQLPGALPIPLAEPGTSNAPPSQDDGGEPPPAAPAEDEERGS